MEQLISKITEETGLSAEKAEEVVGMVIGFVKDKLPGPMASQLDGFMGGGADAGGAGSTMDSVKKGLGGLLGG